MTKEERNAKFAASGVRLTSETAREYQKLGAQKRRENKAARESMQNALNIILSKAVKKGVTVSNKDIEDIDEFKKSNLSAQDAVLLAQITKAISGDTQAAIFVRDTLGEKPVDKVEQGITIEDYVKSHKVKL